jgi:hypothetical protein
LAIVAFGRIILSGASPVTRTIHLISNHRALGFTLLELGKCPAHYCDSLLTFSEVKLNLPPSKARFIILLKWFPRKQDRKALPSTTGREFTTSSAMNCFAISDP